MLFDGSGYRATSLENADLLLIAAALGTHYWAPSGANIKKRPCQEIHDKGVLPYSPLDR
jgi:hypothetical protein